MDNRKKSKWVLDIVTVLAGLCILAVMIAKDPALDFDTDRTVRMWLQTILCSLFMFVAYVAYVTAEVKECHNKSLAESIKASASLATFMVGVFLSMTLYESLPILWGIL